MISDIPAGDGNVANLFFYSVAYTTYSSYLSLEIRDRSKEAFRREKTRR